MKSALVDYFLFSRPYFNIFKSWIFILIGGDVLTNILKLRATISVQINAKGYKGLTSTSEATSGLTTGTCTPQVMPQINIILVNSKF